MSKKTRIFSIIAIASALLIALAIGAQAATAPAITSATHPDGSVYYSNNDPAFNWTYTGEAEVKGYSFSVDQLETAEPDTSVIENVTEKAYTDISDGTWYFHVKAVDVNDNWGDTAHYAVKIDSSAPVGSVVINNGAESTDVSDIVLSLDASDNLSGVAEMRFATSIDALLIEPFKAYSSTDITSLDGINGIKTVYAQFKDASGNLSDIFSDDITLAIDTVAPSVPLISSATHPDSSKYVNNNDPEFTFSSTDELSGVAGYGYVFDQSADTVPAEVINNIIGSLKIDDAADGDWYLHVRGVDNKGNWSGTAHYGIKVDATAPSGSVLINSGAEMTDDFNVNLGLAASDNLSGIAETRFAETLDALANTPYQPFAESASMVLSDVDGLKTVYAQFKDRAGNESAVVSDSITLAPTPYEGTPKLSIAINDKWFKAGNPVVISGKLKDKDGNGLARYYVQIKVRGKIVAKVRTEVGGDWLYTDYPRKTTPYKAVFVDKYGEKINTRAVVAHVKKNKGKNPHAGVALSSGQSQPIKGHGNGNGGKTSSGTSVLGSNQIKATSDTSSTTLQTTVVSTSGNQVRGNNGGNGHGHKK